MTRKSFRAIFAAAAAALLACFLLTISVLYGAVQDSQKDQLITELTLAAAGVEDGGPDYLTGLNTDRCRLTWVASDGTVLFDSQADAAGMENHAQRAEIKAAFDTGVGESVRYSLTRMEQTLYYAARLDNGTVLRVSVSHDSVLALVLAALPPLLAVLILALALSALLANRLSKQIVAPLNALDLDTPLENDTYDELSPLLTHIEQQHQQIRQQRAELSDRQAEFFAVIKNMREGLVLLDHRGGILSINPAALAFFGAEPDCVGRDFLTVERDRQVGEALHRAAVTGHGEVQLSRSAREYRLNVSRIEADEQASGLVILLFDVTEQVFAERNRKEFTANVSHELKTPLHAILGSAELLENGLVQPEDIPRFVGRIRGEAQRLVALVEDIIRLSQLDEQEALPREAVHLYQLVCSEAERLRPVAEGRKITLSVAGGTAVLQSVRQLLHEIVYNLCDNALRYNVEGGSVTVTVEQTDRETVLSVADTGIGIPPEHQARVFERFYRVDKSHSRETGGTGLGLSIVKHAVQDLGGTIALESAPGKGTVISVRFPNAE